MGGLKGVVNRRSRGQGQLHLTALEARQFLSRETAPSTNKLHAKRTLYRDQWYDSKAEASYAAELDLLLAAGTIQCIDRQVTYHFDVQGIRVGTYRADFVLRFRDGHVEVHEVKGGYIGRMGGLIKRDWERTKALMLACHGIAVKEVKV